MTALRATALALLGVAAFAGVGLTYWYYQQTLGYSPPPLQPLSPVQAAKARQEIRHTRQQIEKARSTARKGAQLSQGHSQLHAPRLNLEIREEAINTLLNEDLADRLSHAGIYQPRVRVLPDSIVEAGAWIQRGRRKVWVSGRAQIAANMDKLVLTPLEMRLGNMPMPESVKRRLMERYKPRLEGLDLGLDGQPIQVQSSHGVLRISTAE